MPDIGGPELIILLVVVLLVFGSSKIPKLARSLGQAKKEFEQGVREGAAPDASAPASPSSTAPAAPAAPAPPAAPTTTPPEHADS